MKGVRNILPSLLFLILALPAHADGDLDTKGLMEMCSSKDATLGGICIGYIQGVKDSIDMSRYTRNLPLCVPDSITLGQLFGFVTKYMNKHPEHSAIPAAATVTLALSDTFNCTKEQ
jgi:Rap1a immunity proteins